MGQDKHMVGVLSPAVVLLMSIWCAGQCSQADWLHSCRLCWQLARAHLKPPFPFGSLGLFLCSFPFPDAVLWEGQTVPWQLEVEDFEGKIFLVVMWAVKIYSTNLLASVHTTICQHLMDAIHFGHLLSSLNVKTHQVPLLTVSIFYRNAHSSGMCFSSQGLASFLWKLLAILVTEQEKILLCSTLNEWRIRPLQNILFSWW